MTSCSVLCFVVVALLLQDQEDAALSKAQESLFAEFAVPSHRDFSHSESTVGLHKSVHEHKV